MGAFDFIKGLFGGQKKEETAAPVAAPVVEEKRPEAPAEEPKAQEVSRPSLSQPISTGGGYGAAFETSRETVAEAPAAREAEGVDVKDHPSQEVTLQRAEAFLQNVFKAMDIKVQILRREDEEGTVYELVGERLGILIGKHGQTLDALQYLANLSANKDHSDGHARIILDIEGYRSRREDTLMRLAGHLAEKACRIGQEVHLEPMNRHERKIIHTALQDNRKVSTYSAGEEPRRYVVIVPRRRRRRYDSEY